MNLSRILKGKSVFTNDVFVQVKKYTKDENIAIKNATNVYFYDSGLLKVDNQIINNPLTSTTTQNEIKINTNDKYSISLNKKWILYNNNGDYMLYYNTFYSQDFTNYCNVDTNVSSAKLQFIKYCNLTQYVDYNCNCIVASSSDGYNPDKCLEQVGIDPTKLSTYAKNELSAVCSCINSGCATIRTYGSKIFKRNCDNIAVCNVTLTSDQSKFLSPIQIAQKCGYNTDGDSGGNGGTTGKTTTEPDTTKGSTGGTTTIDGNTDGTTIVTPGPTGKPEPIGPVNPIQPTEPTNPTTDDGGDKGTTTTDTTIKTTTTSNDKQIKIYLFIVLGILILLLILSIIYFFIKRNKVINK